MSLSAALLLSLHFAATPVASCPPASHDRAALDALKAAGFKLEDEAERQQLALDLLACLGDPDPALRDGIVFEALTHWMRGASLKAQTLATLYQDLSAMLKAERAGADPGFRRPFAVLVLAEVARTDRIQPWLDEAQRRDLVQLACDYLVNETDLRGFDEREGWRHGVAHGADLLLQLAANPKVLPAQQEQILAAIASKVRPAGTHFYIYGEPVRLARPLLVLIGRGELPPTRFSDWLKQIADPAPLPDWGQSFSNQAGLAQRHNLGDFLRAVLVGLGEPAQAELAKQVRGLLAGI